jgi:hypothetical protein
MLSESIIKMLTELNCLLRLKAEFSEHNIGCLGFRGKKRSSSAAKENCKSKYITKLAAVLLRAV